MSIFDAILLALFAGVTEIVPVSGTAHLFLMEKLLGLSSVSADQRAYRGMLYLGTALALLLFYRKPFFAMLREFFVFIGAFRPHRRQRGVPFFRRLQFLALMGSLPMLICFFLTGVLEQIEASDYSLAFVSVTLSLNGLILFFVGRSARARRDLQQITLRDALTIGSAQVLSLFPGISRSCVTLSASLVREFDSESALEFSGLLGIPVFFAAGIRQLIVTSTQSERAISVWLLLAGMFLSAAAGLIALRILSDQLSRRRPTGFSYWCWGAGILSLILFLISA